MSAAQNSTKVHIHDMGVLIAHLEAMVNNPDVQKYCGEGFVSEIRDIHTRQHEVFGKLVSSVHQLMEHPL